MQKLRDLISLLPNNVESLSEQLRERISELEEENLRLQKLEETVQRNSRLFEALLRNSRDGVVLLTPEMTILRLVRATLGYRECELLGQSVLSIIHPEDTAVFKDTFLKALSTENRSARCEIRGLAPSGSWEWVEIDISDMLEIPDVQAIVLNHRRTTNIRRHRDCAAELDALRSSEECAIFSESPSGIILNWNAGAEIIFGYTQKEAIGNDVSMLSLPETRQSDAAARNEILESKSCIAGDAVRVHKEGGTVDVRVERAPVLEITGAVCAISHLERPVRAK